jgi:hypothetical protein
MSKIILALTAALVVALPSIGNATSPRSAMVASCYCHGCGCKGGPGWRIQEGPRQGQCVSHANLSTDCGSPASTHCTYEGAPQKCPPGS